MTYNERRRSHGRAIERLVLDELINERIIVPIEWTNMGIYADGQKYLKDKKGDGSTSEQALDEIANIKHKTLDLYIPVIVEVKCMRLINWEDFFVHDMLHNEIEIQHLSHIKSAKSHGLAGVSIIAVNKDSSEYCIRSYNTNREFIDGFCYKI